MSVRSLRRGSIAASRVTAPPTTATVLDLPTSGAGYASTPDSVAVSITSDIDIRVKLAMADWTAGQGFVAKWGSSGQRSYRFYASGTSPGSLQFEIAPSGASGVSDVSSVGHSFTAGSVHWVRATWTNADDVLKFFTSDDGSSWTQLGTNRSISASAIFDSSTAVLVGQQASSGGTNPLAGTIYYAEIRNGVDGTVVAKFDPSTVTPAGTRNPSSFVASTGETWTINGSTWDWAAA